MKIPLSDLDAYISQTKWEDGEVIPSLVFECPLCGKGERSHKHLIPHRPSGGKTSRGRNVWTHVSGTTPQDLTLSPSYLATSSLCTLHAFVRNGQLEVLQDSKRGT